MMTSISPQLRKAGKALADLGKEIEDSQVEDGDPPFKISKKQAVELESVRALLVRVQGCTTTEDHMQDDGTVVENLE